MSAEKKNWILLALKERPLDRLHLMKALFLTWHRAGRNLRNYFTFEPYLYGPCSFEMYRLLEDLSKEQLIGQAAQPVPEWAKYYLTERGKHTAQDASQRVDPDVLQQLQKAVQEVSTFGFSELLRRVYAEAPDFAVNSIVRQVFQR